MTRDRAQTCQSLSGENDPESSPAGQAPVSGEKAHQHKADGKDNHGLYRERMRRYLGLPGFEFGLCSVQIHTHLLSD